MAFNIARISVLLQANARQFNRELGRAESRLRGFGSGVSKLAKGGVAALALAIPAAAAKLVTVNDDLANLADTLSTDVEGLQQLRFIANQNSIEFRTFATAIQGLTRRAGEAADGSDTMQQAFAMMGINASAFLKLNMVERVALLAQSMKDARNNGAELSRVFKLLETEGVQLNRLGKIGAAGVLELANEAKRLGLVSKVAADDAQGFMQGLATLGDTVLGTFQKIGQGFRMAFGMAGKDAITQSISTAAVEAQKLKVIEEGTLSAIEKQAILKKESRGLGQQINLATTFLGRGGGKAQEIKSRQLDTTNQKLETLIGIMRNNATGQFVSFVG